MKLHIRYNALIIIGLWIIFACQACTENKIEEGKDFSFTVINGRDTVTFVMKYINRKPDRGISRSYMIAETETTEGLFAAVDGRKCRKRVENYPVTDVSYIDAEDFISKLNEQINAPYDMQFCLPSPDEWLYAANGGGRGFALPFAGAHSKDEYQFYAWYGGNSNGRAHEVKLLQPNPLKIYDMNGNVWEWCRSENPLAARGSQRPLRGSAWNEVNIWRSDYNGNNPVDSYKSPTVGFRLCLEKLN